MNLIRKIAVLAATGAAASAIVTGCGASQPVTYAPAAYGVPGHCYYVNSPAEAVALEHAGLCPSSWVPTVMPLAWHEQYWDYYDSPAYYGTYVPARVRTVYVHRETTFGRTYRTVIATRAKTATYRSSTGKTVKGTVVTGKAKFGSGTSFGTTGRKYGGGSARTGTSSRTSRTGTSTGSRSTGRSFGGGSARSGGRR
jgi:hypothetical protein